MRFLTLAAVLGLTACMEAVPPTEAVPCLSLSPEVEDLRRGLSQHPETPDAVAEPAVNIVLGTEAVCDA